MTLSDLWHALVPWLQVLSLVGAVVQCLGVWALWSLTKKFVTREDCDICRQELEKRLKQQEDTSGELKSKVEYAPTKEDVVAVDKDNQGVRGDIKALAATIQAQGEAMRAMGRQLNLLMEHHLGRKQ